MAGKAEAYAAIVETLVRGDAEALVAASHPDLEAETLRSAIQGAWRGHDGARAFVHDTAETFDVFEPRYDEVSELPDGRLLAIGTIHVRTSGGGVEMDVPTAAVIEFRDGLMYRYKDYSDAGAARAAVG